MKPLSYLLYGAFWFILLLSGIRLQHYDLQENSTGWFQAKRALFPHLEMYTDRWTYEPGDTVQVFGSSFPAKEGTLRLQHILPGESNIIEASFSLSTQKVADSVSIKGCQWNASYAVILPDSIQTGWFILSLSTRSAQTHTSVFIKPKEREKDVAMLLSTNTWNAYNHWGGYSLYTRNKSTAVSGNRPHPLADPFLPSTLVHHQWYYQSAEKDTYVALLLQEEGVPFDAYSMDELEIADSTLFKYPVWIISTHSEYWSENMLIHLNKFLDQGGSLISLSGNTAAYISYVNHLDRTLSVDKRDDQLWYGADTMGLKPFGTRTHMGSFQQYAPYEVEVDSSWIFSGTGLQKGDLFGAKSLTYDYFYSHASAGQLIRGLLSKGKTGAASGMEVDFVDPERTLPGWTTVASGKNPSTLGMGEVYPEKLQADKWNSLGGADMGYYLTEGGGLVFNASSLAFTGAIPLDTSIQQILRNVFQKGLAISKQQSLEKQASP
ncbi:MAG: N,N-dimethylformamidase beta subunit family domain-containing protein [Bacteroidota bacterium]